MVFAEPFRPTLCPTARYGWAGGIDICQSVQCECQTGHIILGSKAQAPKRVYSFGAQASMHYDDSVTLE
jgi:hypothetical protein